MNFFRFILVLFSPLMDITIFHQLLVAYLKKNDTYNDGCLIMAADSKADMEVPPGKGKPGPVQAIGLAFSLLEVKGMVDATPSMCML